MTERDREHDDGADARRSISRRDLLKSAGAVGAAAVVPGGLAAHAVPTAAAAVRPAPPTGPLMSLTAAETELLSAMVDRLIPSDELGPGALEAGVLRFIDRALSEADSSDVEAYRVGLAALDGYARSSRGAPFVELGAVDRDSVLIDVQTGAATGAGAGFDGSSAAFFDLVKGHTWQGMFGDPQYGGNVAFAGWDLVRYPGVRMRVTDEEQRRLERAELPPVRQSAYDYETFRHGDDA